MDIKAAEKFLDGLFSSLESLETQSAAILQFLKQQSGATDEQLAPYFEQAGNASNVRWRAARLRLMSLLSAAMKDAEPAEKSSPATKSQSAPRAAEEARQPIGAQKESSDSNPAQSDSEHSKQPSPEPGSQEQTKTKARSRNNERESLRHPERQQPDDEKTPPDIGAAASRKHETSEAGTSKQQPPHPEPSKKDAA